MTDPQPLPGRRKPRPAEPIQPDVPGSGDDKKPAADNNPAHADRAEKIKKQTETAMENVREGYD